MPMPYAGCKAQHAAFLLLQATSMDVQLLAVVVLALACACRFVYSCNSQLSMQQLPLQSVTCHSLRKRHILLRPSSLICTMRRVSGSETICTWYHPLCLCGPVTATRWKPRPGMS